MSQVVAVGKEDKPFVGRENEQKEYWDFLAGNSDDPWLLVISGLGGIGKSRLLNTLYKQTLEQHAPPDTFAIPLNFDTGTNTGPSPQTDSIQLDSSLQTSAPQPDASLRTDPLLFLNELAHWLKLHCDLQQFDAFTETLQKGQTQLAQFKEQVEQTSQSFAREHGMQPPSDARQKIRFAELEVNRQVRELVTEAFYRQVDTFQPERLVIMLDTCELLNEADSWIFSQWLMNEFLPELHSRMWRKPCFIVMASRIPPESEVIDEYDQQQLILSMLDEDAVDAYLEEMGVDDPVVRHDLSQSIYKITRGHALCVAIIAQSYQKMGQEALKDIDASVQTEFDEKASLTLINERILNRLDDPFKGLTQYGVLLRTFNLPLLRAVFPELLPESDAKAIFDQFIRYPYIESRGNYRYAFHELIREVLAKNTQKKDLATWRQYHKKALDYFTAREAPSRSMDWYYHNLAYEEAQGMSDWRRALQEARDRGDTQSISSLLQITDDVALDLTALSRAECAYEWGRLSVDRRQPLDKALEKYKEALRFYEQIEDHQEEVRQGRASVLQAMGDAQQSQEQLDQAINSYQSALDLLQHYEKRSIEVEAQVLKKIGDVQQLKGNLDALNSALESYQQALRLFQEVGNRLQEAQVLKKIGDVQQQRGQLVRDPGDLNLALENYEQALGLLRQAKNRSGEDEAKLLEAIGDVCRSRYRLSGDQQDLNEAIGSYQDAFGLFSDDIYARKRVKEKVKVQKQWVKPTQLTVATAPKWTIWHTLGIIGIIVVVVLVLLLIPVAYRLWSWLGTMLFLTSSGLVMSHGITGYWRGLLIDQRNRISLSRLQVSLWTLVTSSSYASAALLNIRFGQADPLMIAIPAGIWVLMGISATSLVSTPFIHNYKQNQDANNEQTAKMLTQLSAQRVDTSQLDTAGRLLVNKSPADAKWIDLFRGEEVGNAAQIDLGKIQLFFVTIISVLVYAITLGSLFAHQIAVISSFPDLNQSVLALLGISNGTYLTNKAVPHSTG